MGQEFLNEQYFFEKSWKLDDKNEEKKLCDFIMYFNNNFSYISSLEF